MAQSTTQPRAKPEPSRAGFNDADRILRSAIQYYWPEAYKSEPALSLGNVKLLDDKTFRLQYPAALAYWTLAISFTKVEGRDDVLWVRSTNWRCEHEPFGAMRIEHARDLYKRLIATGMQAF